MFRIQIDGLNPGAISRSVTTDEGIYRGVINGAVQTMKLTPAADFNLPPTSLGSAASPLGIKTAGGRVSLGPKTLPYVAAEGNANNFRARGRAKLFYDVSVVFRVVQDSGDPPRPNVPFLATGVIDGFTNAQPNSLVPGVTEASLDALIEIPNLEKVVASSSASGSVTATNGITVGTDSLSIGPQASKQVTSAGNRANTFVILKSVPVNQPLVCRINLSLMAAANALDVPVLGVLLREAASAVLTTQHVFLIPDPPGTAVVSSAAATVSLGVGGVTVALANPLTNLGRIDCAQGHAEGAFTESGLSVDYSGFRPEVSAVFVNGDAAPADPLRGALLSYPTMAVSGIAPDGSVQLTGGTLTFSDAASGAALATAQLSNVKASVALQTVTADVTQFTAVGFNPAASAVGAALIQRNGTLTFWSDAVSAIQAGVGLGPGEPPMPLVIVPNP